MTKMPENDIIKALEFAKNYEICNAHAHIYPAKIAQKAVTNVGSFYGIDMDIPVGTSEMLLADSEPFGVTNMLVCSAATDPSQVESINSFIIDECQKHDKFIGFGTLHAGYEGDFTKELDRLIQNGIRGIKLHTDFQKFNIDDRGAYKMYEAIEGRVPILFHMGDPRYDFSAPKRLAKLLKDFPKLQVIAAHLGGYTAWEEARNELYGNDRVYYDCSSSLFVLSPEKATELIREIGTDRVFFGTDFPMWNIASELLRFEKLTLSDDERRAIFSGNFKSYFGIK